MAWLTSTGRFEDPYGLHTTHALSKPNPRMHPPQRRRPSHGTDRDDGSLVFDVIEEFRAPFVDRLLLGMFGRGFVPATDRHGRLNTRSWHKLARAFLKGWQRPQAWRSQQLSGAEILTSQVRDLSRFFAGEGRYRPYRMKW